LAECDDRLDRLVGDDRIDPAASGWLLDDPD
jgi:hypothetical protein